jgi:colanic acid/amylovoran biosynthesis glycosyltransferase
MICVWKTAWLPYSETFVRNQAQAFSSPVVTAGLIRLHSSLVTKEDRIIFGGGRLAKLRLKLFRRLGRDRAVTRFFQAQRPDFVLVHFLSDALLIAPTLRRLGIPFGVMAHGYDVAVAPRSRAERGLRAKRMESTLRSANLAIGVSEPISALLKSHGAPPESVLTHHIGVPISRFEFSESHERWDICSVGRMVEKKGFDDLLAAASLLPSPALRRIAIVGDGPLRSKLEAQATQLGLSVDFLGALSPTEVAQVMRSSRIFALASKVASDGDTEGLPTVVIEASLLARPVVAYSHSGIPEAVIHGVTGLLVPEGDVTELAKSLDEVLTHPRLAAKLGIAARTHAMACFDIDVLTRELEVHITRKLRGPDPAYESGAGYASPPPLPGE